MANDTIAPTVLWAQRKDRVFVSIQLEDVTDEKITVDANKLSFSAKCHNKIYAIDLNFHGEISPEESKQRKGGREYYFDLKKKETDKPFWPRLLNDKIKRQNIKIDFNRWKDEDESDDEASGGMYDDASLEDMMQQMGTGGGAGSFDPGEMGDDSEDSDDEDIPDLENDVGEKATEPEKTD